MILVLTGTNPFDFKRLVCEIDEIAKSQKKEVTIQLGNTKYIPKYCKWFRFKPREELLQLIEESEYVITQGGYGGIKDCLVLGKKVIAVPRYKNLNECVDDQSELVQYLENKGALIAVYEIDKLNSAIHELNRIESKKYFINDSISNYISEYVEALFA